MKPIIDTTKISTAQGHFVKLPYLQQAVMNFDKEELVQAKTWDEVRVFFAANCFLSTRTSRCSIQY